MRILRYSVRKFTVDMQAELIKPIDALLDNTKI